MPAVGAEQNTLDLGVLSLMQPKLMIKDFERQFKVSRKP